MRRALTLGLSSVAAVAALMAAPAAAFAGTAPGASSPGQAGIQITGGNFRFVSANVFLRDGGQFAPEVGGVGGSVSMWASDGKVILLGISTGTGASNEPYSAGVTVYQAAPYGCSPEPCTPPGVISQGNPLLNEQTCLHGVACVPGDSFNVADQQSVNLQIYYNRNTGILTFQERSAAGDVYQGSYHVGVGEHFTKLVISSDFGDWLADSQGYVAAPPVQTSYLRWSGAQITSYTGHTGGLVDWWTRTHLSLAGAPGGAKAGSISGDAFRTFLTP